MSIIKRYEEYYKNRKLPQQEGDIPTAEDLSVYFTELTIIKRREGDGHVIDGEFKQDVLETHYEFMTKLGLPKGNNLGDKTVRTYEELVEFLNGESIETEDEVGTENEFVFEEEQQQTEEGDTSLGEFNFEFDTENNIGGESGIPIVRRGTGETVNQTGREEQEQEYSSNENGLEDYDLTFNFNEGEDDGVYETNPFEPEEETRPQERPRLNQQEELDNQNVLSRHQMISRFANSQGGEEVRRDAQGNIEIDYGTTILMSFEEESRKDEALFAESVEFAIDHLHSIGFVYEKSLNIFVRTGQSGHREYARIFLDLDFRGLLG